MANPWVHCRIDNQSSYDLILVEKSFGGSKNYRWNKEPPAKIPAGTAMNDVYDAMADDAVWGYVYCQAKYDVSVDGFVVRITLSVTANDHPAGESGASWTITKDGKPKDKILNVYQNPKSPHGREITVTWTIREWPD
jgi:hypothetical protein